MKNFSVYLYIYLNFLDKIDVEKNGCTTCKYLFNIATYTELVFFSCGTRFSQHCQQNINIFLLSYKTLISRNSLLIQINV